MTRKQLQTLISAGVFSAALLSGAAYAEDAANTMTPAAGTTAPAKSTGGMKKKHKKMAMKETAKHSCAGQNGCKGQGGCATDGSKKGTTASTSMPQHSCKGQNSCKGQGGCASS